MGHLNTDCKVMRFPLSCDALAASIISNTCSAFIRGSFPVASASHITEAPCCHMVIKKYPQRQHLFRLKKFCGLQDFVEVWQSNLNKEYL